MSRCGNTPAEPVLASDVVKDLENSAYWAPYALRVLCIFGSVGCTRALAFIFLADGQTTFSLPIECTQGQLALLPECNSIFSLI